jgi:glycosyltransferase involved in cell wall biosynthesis
MELLLFLQTHADCLVHPSRTEGFGLGVAEAMDARIPVIVSDAGALPWLLEDGRCGVLVRERSSRAWTEAMLAAGKAVSARKLETSHGEGGADGWTSVAELARLRIASLCDPHGIAERHLEIYTKTLHR